MQNKPNDDNKHMVQTHASVSSDLKALYKSVIIKNGEGMLWKSPGDYAKYQLDYILVKTRYRNSVLNGHTLPRADADTDHNLFVVKICIALKKLRKSTLRKRWDKEKLKNKIVEFPINVDSKLAQVSPVLTDEPDDY